MFVFATSLCFTLYSTWRTHMIIYPTKAKPIPDWHDYAVKKHVKFTVDHKRRSIILFCAYLPLRVSGGWSLQFNSLKD